MSSADPPATRDVAAFVAALETGSMGGAAQRLDLTQSAVTKRVRSLEVQLGVALLRRGRDGVRPTPAGTAFYREARVALAALQRGEALMQMRRGEQATRLRVAASHTIGEYLLPDWVGSFRQRPSAPRVEVLVVNSPAVVEAVRERAVDLGFIESADAAPGLEARTVGHDELLAIVARDHPWAARAAVLPRHLAGAPYLSREAGSGTRSVAETALRRVGLVLDPVVQVGSLQSLKRSVAEGAGFALLSARVVEREVAAGELVALPVRGVDLRRGLRMLRCRDHAHGIAAERFWRWLESKAPCCSPSRIDSDCARVSP